MIEGGDANAITGDTINRGPIADGNSVPPVVPVDDPLAPDAPIHHLLSIRHNPLVANMTVEELTVLVRRCREYATSAPTLSAKLATDALNVDPKRRKTNSVAAKKKSILEDL